jgi:Protoglobin
MEMVAENIHGYTYGRTDIIAFLAVINDTIKPYSAAKTNSEEEMQKMHRAWCKSTHIQLALWARPYTEAKHGLNEW